MARFTRLEAALIEALGVVAVLFIIVAFFFGGRPASAMPKCTANLARHVPVVGNLAPLKLDIKAETDIALEQPLTIADLSYERPAMARAFGARTKEVRLLLARMNGGGEDTENAMEMALAYLARMQKDDGSWSNPVPLGSTGLALICFLGAGYHHQSGDYQEVVAKGLQYLLSRQNENGGLNGETVYSHSIAGMVFAEAYGLTGDPVCRQAAEKMLAFLARAQNDKGAWYYQPSSPDCDTSVSGWAIMAFKSAKMAGLAIPHEVVEKYLRYAKSITEAEVNTAEEAKKNHGIWKGMAHYGIRNNKPEKRFPYPMTASVLMCRLYMENDRNAPLLREGVEHITTRLPANLKPQWVEKHYGMDHYLWYHAAQVGFLWGGEAWTMWNDSLRRLLVEKQIKEGDRKGTWGENNWFQWGERSDIYHHTILTMILQTYYRYYR